MREILKFLHRHRQAIYCALFLPACMVAAWPFAETGMYDDWSYVRTAEVFAQTSHVVFNGWGAPILGIQLLPAAFMVKIFGSSFVVLRITTMIVALITTALLQRTIVLCGVSEWNATITLMTSPAFLPVTTGFLTDVWCLLAIVVCLYCCLRSLSAAPDREAIAWIVCATLGDAAIGSSRQIAWLGMLVMVPATLWLLRGRPRIIAAGVGSLAFGYAIMFTLMGWFARHPYTLAESLRPHNVRLSIFHPSILSRPVLEAPMLMLPVMLMFAGGVFKAKRRGLIYGAAVATILCVLAACEHYRHLLRNWYAPFMTEIGCLFGARGVYNAWPIWGGRPAAMAWWARAAISALTGLAIVSWVAVTAGEVPGTSTKTKSGNIGWQELRIVLVPFAVVYAMFLLPRAFRDLTIDRYLEPLLLVGLIFLCRQYQDRIGVSLPRLSLMATVLIAGYSVATLQDAFAMYRAVVVAANELTASGVPRTHFDGGWEYDGMSQILAGGYVHQSGIRLPGGKLMYGHRRTGPCEQGLDVWIPDVEPEYTLSYQRDGCGGATAYAPVTYTRWYLRPHTFTAYVVKDPDYSGKHGLFPSF